MSSLFPRLLADISTLPWIAIIAIIGGFLVAIVGMITGIWFAQRRQQMWHETARVALEKGQPLPKMPDEDSDRKPSAWTAAHDIRTGLVCIAAGAGLYFFLGGIGGRIGYVGFIPGFIGVALLIFGLCSLAFKRKDPPSSGS